MRLRTVLGITVGVIALGASAVSVWILRQPIQQTLATLHREVPATGPKVRFAVVGDNHGDNPVYRQILEEVKDQPLDFMVNLADASEYGRREELLTVKERESILPFPVYHTVGNHDIKTDPSRALFSEIFQTSPWASYDHGDTHLIVLDNADRKVGFPNASLDWLETDLAAHREKTIVIAYHRPFDLPLGQVVGDDETAASRVTNRRFKKIISSYSIKYIFTGHLHTYLPYTVNDIPAVVSGGGGDPAQTVLGGPKNNLFHYLIVTVQGGDVDVEIHRVQLRTNPNSE